MKFEEFVLPVGRRRLISDDGELHEIPVRTNAGILTYSQQISDKPAVGHVELTVRCPDGTLHQIRQELIQGKVTIVAPIGSTIEGKLIGRTADNANHVESPLGKTVIT